MITDQVRLEENYISFDWNEFADYSNCEKKQM